MYRLSLRASASLGAMRNVVNHHISPSKIILTNIISSNTYHTSTLLFKDALTPVPKMGDSITEGTLLKFTKNVGESVAVDEIVAVIETDKVSNSFIYDKITIQE